MNGLLLVIEMLGSTVAERDARIRELEAQLSAARKANG